MTATQLIVVAVAVFIAAFVQIIAGFGFALLSMPIMTLALPVKQAVVVSTLLGMISTTWQARTLRQWTDKALAKRLIIAAFCGMPLGLVILNVVSDKALRLTLGTAVIRWAPMSAYIDVRLPLAELPGTASEGQRAWASDGRKVGEGAGAAPLSNILS